MEAEGKKDEILVDKNSEKKGNVGFSVDDEALRKCLEEKKGHKSAMTDCKSILEALKSSSSSEIKKPLTPLGLRSGCLTDV